MVFYKASDVIWNPVGLEGEETRVFIITGRVGTAIWSRIDGCRSVRDIEAEMVQHLDADDSAASSLLRDFFDKLEKNGLITAIPSDNSLSAPACNPFPWPDIMVPPTLEPFDMEPFISSDLVALGSFAGGNNNTTSNATCWGGTEGGVNDVGGGFVCGPGSGYGYVNGGLFFTSCG